MNRAIKQARNTIENFLKQLGSSKPNQTHFSVKKPFLVGKVDLKSLKSGDPISLLPLLRGQDRWPSAAK